jgi:hypothetical protein
VFVSWGLQRELRGGGLPFFAPSRGLRQGDPISRMSFFVHGRFHLFIDFFGGNYVDIGIRVGYKVPRLTIFCSLMIVSFLSVETFRGRLD